MRFALAWMKANFIVVVSIVLCLASIGTLFYIHARGREFVGRVALRQQQVRKIQGLGTTSVRVPPERPDDKPRQVNIAVNKKAIDALRDIYAQMNKEYQEIYKYAVTVNSQGHLPMLDGLFPEPSRSPTRAFDARFYYQSAFDEYFKPYSPAADLPRLHAAAPPTVGELQVVMDRAENEFKSTNLVTSISEEDRTRLNQFKTKKVSEYLMRYAKEIHLYAETDPQKPNYPFQIMPWAKQDNQPDPRDLWEAQMQMWIIQDIARAIAQTNHVENPEVNVMNAPIKRLVQIVVVPDYVGVTGRGAMHASGPTAYQPQTATAKPPPAGGQPAPAAAPNTPLTRTAVKLPDDFSLSATGRRSNDIYDVRHVWLTMVMDSQRIPEFFDYLSQVNFMTVLKVEITDEDEYEAVKEGCIYGPGDAVKVKMLIETIWLRDWTMKLMPQAVRDMLLPPPLSPS